MSQNSLHNHHAVQFCVGLDSDLQYRTAPDLAWTRQQSLVVPVDHPHQLDPAATRVASFFLAPEHRGFVASVVEPLRPNKLRELPAHVVSELASTASFLDEAPVKSVNNWRTTFLSPLLTLDAPVQIDSRIHTAIGIINDTVSQKISLNDIAKRVNLSPSRFAHVFKESTSLPFRQFVLWQRLQRAAFMFGQELSLTEIAHSVGFSDSSHLSRTFRSMFGTSPSDLTRNSQFIQVTDEATPYHHTR